MVGNSELDQSLKGARVLVVEDEWVISELLVELLVGHGCEVVGPSTCVAKANALASVEEIDCALLDLNLNGETVYSVAKTLSDRNIPFAFVTGYSGTWVSENYRQRPALQKPIRADKLKQVLSIILSHRAH